MLNQFQMFDSHFHIIDRKFPLIPNNGYTPDEFTCKDYLEKTSKYNLCGGAIVSGSFQAYDQTYLVDALQKLGASFVGVTQLPVTATDNEILRLNTAGVRAVRFNLRRGGSEGIFQLSTMAKRVYEIAGWHVELYADSRELIDLYDMLIALPSVSIDHLGLSKSGINLMKKLMEKGVRVKATGFGRVNFDVSKVLKELYRVNPEALMFGTDLPSTRSPEPYTEKDFILVMNALGNEGAINVLSRNAIEFYRLQESTDSTWLRTGLSREPIK